ncbi:MAG: rubrerythrin [Acetobacteraceae bacterium]|nr:rubrerythrin [Acetobacteraceae bacterium]
MVSLDGTRTDVNLKHAFSDEGRFDRRYLSHEQTADAAGYRGLAAVARAAAGSGAYYARGHLDHPIADRESDAPARTSATQLAAAMIDEHTGMARTAHAEGFEDFAGWFETLAKARRSHARRMRRAPNTDKAKT